MKLQNFKPLNKVYKREEDFSADLAENISLLNIGDYDDVEIEASVGTRKADIVATGSDGVTEIILVIENQFGKADWDHWGRLEAYARLKEAKVAALIAEDFEELMVVNCNLRNEDGKIDWYLIRVQVNEHGEFAFHLEARPAIDIQTRKNVEYSDFWAPIREKGLFAGKPVPLRDEGWIGKGIRGITLILQLLNNSCQVLLSFQGENRLARRDQAIQLFTDSSYNYELKESPKFANIVFPVMDKGKRDKEYWPEIREQLTQKGSEIYDRISSSDV